jgi:hypothetical protein
MCVDYSHDIGRLLIGICFVVVAINNLLPRLILKKGFNYTAMILLSTIIIKEKQYEYYFQLYDNDTINIINSVI